MYQQMTSKFTAFHTTIRIKNTTLHQVPISANTSPPAIAIVIPVLIRGAVPFPILPDEPAT
jgi:hypothetical protein